jgi:hypothetical protein
MSKTIDYEFKRGDTTNLKKFRITDANGEVITLGATEQLYFTIKKNANSSTVLLQKTIGNGITLGDDGYYHITIESVDTYNLAYGDYQYDIEFKTISPKEMVKTIIDGTITLTDEITWRGDE